MNNDHVNKDPEWMEMSQEAWFMQAEEAEAVMRACGPRILRIGSTKRIVITTLIWHASEPIMIWLATKSVCNKQLED